MYDTWLIYHYFCNITSLLINIFVHLHLYALIFVKLQMFWFCNLQKSIVKNRRIRPIVTREVWQHVGRDKRANTPFFDESTKRLLWASPSTPSGGQKAPFASRRTAPQKDKKVDKAATPLPFQNHPGCEIGPPLQCWKQSGKPPGNMHRHERDASPSRFIFQKKADDQNPISTLPYRKSLHGVHRNATLTTTKNHTEERWKRKQNHCSFNTPRHDGLKEKRNE